MSLNLSETQTGQSEYNSSSTEKISTSTKNNQAHVDTELEKEMPSIEDQAEILGYLVIALSRF